MAVAEQTWQSYQAAGLAEIDPTVAGLVDKELGRQRDQLELIASENFTWPAVLQAVGSVLTNKYAEGYPGRRYYGGCELVDEVEQLAIDRAKELFGADHANVQPHAGAPANQAAYFALLEHGDPVLGLRLDHGGHLTHGLKVNFSGRNYDVHRLRRPPRGPADRLRRGAAAGAGGAAQADRRRRLGVPAGDRRRRVPRDRRRGRRAADGRHGALRRAGRRRAPSEPRRARRRRHLDDPQDAGRARVRGSCSAGPSTRRQSTRPCSRACRAARCATRSPPRRSASSWPPATPSGPTSRRSWPMPRRSPQALIDGGLDLVTGGTDVHLLQLDLRRTQWSGKDAEERLHEVSITSTATRCRSTSGRRRSPPACASARRP